MTKPMKFETQLFGYHRSKVNRKFQQMQNELLEVSQQLQTLTKKLESSDRERNELGALVAAMKQHNVETVNQLISHSSLVILVGPSDSIASLAKVIDLLEHVPNLTISFRIFRDGFYRVDGQSEKINQIASWLKLQEDVHEVEINGETIHVIPTAIH